MLRFAKVLYIHKEILSIAYWAKVQPV